MGDRVDGETRDAVRSVTEEAVEGGVGLLQPAAAVGDGQRHVEGVEDAAEGDVAAQQLAGVAVAVDDDQDVRRQVVGGDAGRQLLGDAERRELEHLGRGGRRRR